MVLDCCLRCNQSSSPELEPSSFFYLRTADMEEAVEAVIGALEAATSVPKGLVFSEARPTLLLSPLWLSADLGLHTDTLENFLSL